MSDCFSSRELRSPADFEEYLRRTGVQARLAGDAQVTARVDDISGNINRVRRVSYVDLSGRVVGSCVVKHVPAGGALERYPSIRFPEDRLAFEAFYYRASSEAFLDRWVPSILAQDIENRVLVAEDLAPSMSLERCLLSDAFPEPQFFANLGRDLGRFHRGSLSLEVPAGFRNNPTAAANRPYVLTLPLEHPEQMRAIWSSRDGGEGLAVLQAHLFEQAGERLAAEARSFESDFKSGEPSVLTHGDLHGESIFVREGSRATVLDAELCDPGAAWFDPGMLLAHLLMLTISLARPVPYAAFLRAYLDEMRHDGLLKSILKMAGFEMIRRVIGAANSPFVDSQEKRRQVLRQATILVLEPQSSSIHREVIS
ncbi:MAG: phosphotransferase [Candidatus Wallbacteria bacterium]|nr:phosphotransferase [Candidatus Wallbacteria bacterium]